jgi:creatinine amidohydrolase
MPHSIKMAESYWPEIAEAFDQNIPVIIPLGAGCKEHGHHLPMNTDLIMAEYLANWVFNQYQIILAPTLQDSYFPAFEEYPGSTTLSFETARDVIVEKCVGWHQQGAKQFYILNTGISTNKPLLAASQILNDKGIPFHYFDFSRIDADAQIKAIQQQTVGTHADEIETSIMLYIKPEVVKLDKARPEESPDKPGRLTRNITSTDKTISVTGAWGNPTMATIEKGVIAVRVIKEILDRELEELGFNVTQTRVPDSSCPRP